MAAFWHTRYLLAVIMVMFYLRPLTSDAYLTFSFKNFGEDSDSMSQIALLEDANVSNESNSVQISGSWVSKGFRSWVVISRKNTSFVAGNSPRMVSFSISFVFSMSRDDVNGFTFFMHPSNYSKIGSIEMLLERKEKFLAVEFNTSKDDERYGDLNGNHVRLDAEIPFSVKVSNVSCGEKLRAWIEYESSGQIFEVRLNKYGRNKPVNPLLSRRIDLSAMWEEGHVLLGLSSSSGNFSQKINIYSWNFNARILSHLLHSEPLNPSDFVGVQEVKARKKSDCASRILAALILGTGFGALGALLVLFVWAFAGDRRPVVPGDFDIEAKELEFKKVDASADTSIEDGKK